MISIRIKLDFQNDTADIDGATGHYYLSITKWDAKNGSCSTHVLYIIAPYINHIDKRSELVSKRTLLCYKHVQESYKNSLRNVKI